MREHDPSPDNRGGDFRGMKNGRKDKGPGGYKRHWSQKRTGVNKKRAGRTKRSRR